jgi:hypothetical protein
MVKKLAAATALAAAVSVGMMAAPSGAATPCSQLFCYQFGVNSATVWTNLGPLGGSVTVQAPVSGILPLAP